MCGQICSYKQNKEKNFTVSIVHRISSLYMITDYDMGECKCARMRKKNKMKEREKGRVKITSRSRFHGSGSAHSPK